MGRKVGRRGLSLRRGVLGSFRFPKVLDALRAYQLECSLECLPVAPFVNAGFQIADGISDGSFHRSMGYSIGRVDAPPPGHSVPVTMPPGPPALWLAPGDTRMSLMLRANPESPHGVSLLLCGVTAVVGIVDINHR